MVDLFFLWLSSFCCTNIALTHFVFVLDSLFSKLDAILSERIMIFDGGMGTMLQRYRLKEEDFRGIFYSMCALWTNNLLTAKPSSKTCINVVQAFRH